VNRATWTYDDGGRKTAGFRGETSDCVVRAIAIAERRPYGDVYADLKAAARHEVRRRGKLGFLAATGRGSSPRNGWFKETYHPYLLARGWRWVPTMKIGSGCTVHLRADELPTDRGPLIVSVSRHLTTVVNGVVRDTHDPSRGGRRCVYGYFWKADAEPICTVCEKPGSECDCEPSGTFA